MIRLYICQNNLDAKLLHPEMKTSVLKINVAHKIEEYNKKFHPLTSSKFTSEVAKMTQKL